MSYNYNDQGGASQMQANANVVTTYIQQSSYPTK